MLFSAKKQKPKQYRENQPIFQHTNDLSIPSIQYCEPTKTEEAQKEVPTSKEDELTAHFRLPQKGDGPEKVWCRKKKEKRGII